MKFYLYLLTFSFTFMLFSCENIEHVDQGEVLNIDSESVERTPDCSWVKLRISCWEDWGRDKHDCESGWGLCRYESCWFWQGPCCGHESWPSCNATPVSDIQGLGYTYRRVSSSNDTSYIFETALSWSNAEQYLAIQNQDTLYIDNDLIDSTYYNNQKHKIIMEEGAYEFNPQVGPNGGYRFEVIYIIE